MDQNKMDDEEMIICIPGPWKDRADLLRRVMTSEPMGQFLFAGMVLADTAEKDHIGIEVYGRDPDMGRAFELGGQGKIPAGVLREIGEHQGVVYLHFPRNLIEQRPRVMKFTRVLQEAGGLGVKMECSGVALSWERWFQRLSGTLFDLYCSAVCLIEDEESFYSCGMHHFGMPEVSVPRWIPSAQAAELMNQFNVWRIGDEPVLGSGHTFSLDADGPRYRMELTEDARHESEHLVHNPHGVWELSPA